MERAKTYDAAHSTIGLDSLALVVEVLSRSLSRTRQQSTHHHSASTQSESLDDMPHIRNTTIRNNRYTEPVREFGHRIHCCRLGTTTSHDLLSNADGART